MKKLILFALIISALAFGIPQIPSVYAQSYTFDELQQMAQQAARRYRVDVSLVFALINQESRWHPNIVSPKGAIGLMQIMPSTGKGFCGLTKKQLYDPHNNLDCGVRYFNQQLKRFGSVELALCAYNAGPNRVAKLGHCPTFKETTHYVHNIMTAWNGNLPSYDVPQRATSVTPPAPVFKRPKRKKIEYVDAEKLYCQYFPNMCRQEKLLSYQMESMPESKPLQSRSIADEQVRQPSKLEGFDAMKLYCQTFPDMCY